MIKKKSILLPLALLLSISVFAENIIEKNKDKSFDFKFSIGWTFGCYKESTFANISQSILSPRYQLEATIKSGNFMHTITADYYTARPKSAMTETAVVYKTYDPVSGESYYDASISPLSVHKIRLQYDLDYRIIRKDKIDFYTGGSFLCNAFLQFEHYPSITGLISIGPSAAASYQINDNNKLSLTGSIPLLGYGVRPPYAGCDAQLMKYAEEDFMKILTLGSFLSLHNYQSILLNFEYTVKAAKHFSTGLGLNFEYARIAVPKERPLYYVDGNLKTFAMLNF